MPDYDLHGSAFLSEFSGAGKAMRKAAAEMLICSQIALDPASRKSYDRTHKKMVKLIREWHSLEQTREAVHEGDTPKPFPETP